MSNKKEVMVYSQSFTTTEKTIARSNIGAAAPISPVSYGPTGATLVFKSTDTGAGKIKVICNANLTEAGNYILNYNFVCHANAPNQLYNMIIGLNTGDGTYMISGASSNYVALLSRNEYHNEDANSCSGSLILTASTKAIAESVHFAMKSSTDVTSQQKLYIDYFSWNILKLG